MEWKRVGSSDRDSWRKLYHELAIGDKRIFDGVLLVYDDKFDRYFYFMMKIHMKDFLFKYK